MRRPIARGEVCQVFLDETGEELHRHVGFHPQAGIEALLVEQGLTKVTAP